MILCRVQCPAHGTSTPAARRNRRHVWGAGLVQPGLCLVGGGQAQFPKDTGPGGGPWGPPADGWHQACSPAQLRFRHPGREPRPRNTRGHRKARAPVPADPEAGSPGRWGLGRSEAAPIPLPRLQSTVPDEGTAPPGGQSLGLPEPLLCYLSPQPALTQQGGYVLDVGPLQGPGFRASHPHSAGTELGTETMRLLQPRPQGQKHVFL